MAGQIDTRVIARSPLGTELSEQECQTLAGIMQVHSLADGEVLRQEGQTDNALYLLASGTLDVSKAETQGNVHLHSMHEGELGGAMGFLDGIQRSTTLRAVGTATVYSLERDAFESLLESDPRTVYRIMRAIKLDAGEHQVTLYYRPASFLWGCAVSAVTLLGAIGWWFHSRKLRS